MKDILREKILAFKKVWEDDGSLYDDAEWEREIERTRLEMFEAAGNVEDELS